MNHGLRAAHGFTLMEMLVTLVIFALVSGLLWQAMAQVARLEGRMAVWTSDNRDRALREEWLRELLRGMATGASGDSVRFIGTRERLSGYTNMPPWPDVSGPLPVELRLQSDAMGRITTLVAHDSGRSRALTLFTWPSRAHFAYLDEAGDWHETWPPPLGEPVPLPKAVRLSGLPQGDMVVAIPATGNPMLRRADFELP